MYMFCLLNLWWVHGIPTDKFAIEVRSVGINFCEISRFKSLLGFEVNQYAVTTKICFMTFKYRRKLKEKE